MSRRTDQRRDAVFACYQHDLTGRPIHELFEFGSTLFTRSLTHEVFRHQAEIDQLISEKSEGWTLERIAPLERAVLRVALLEMLYPESVPSEQAIPPEGAINEAIEIAKEFCSDRAPAFINGILAAVLADKTKSMSLVWLQVATPVK